MTEILAFGFIAMTALNATLLLHTYQITKRLNGTQQELFQEELNRRNEIVKNNPDFRPGRYLI